MRILFTSVGRRVELMQAFHNAAIKSNIPLIIYGADMTKDAPALFYCDKQIQICRISDEKYISQLLNICKEEHINAVIPTIDTDLLRLSHYKEDFAKIGTRVIISEENKIAICRDKRLTSDFFIQCGLKAPLPVDNVNKYENRFPCFIKPKDGSSSVNAYRANDKEELENLAKQVPDYIIQPFVFGEEYTVDIFCDFESQPIYITPRKRLAVRSGEVLKTEIALDEKIIDECKQLIRQFQPIGAITVQLIREYTTNEDYYIEINPRFGGGAPLSMKAGADSAEALLRILDRQKLEYSTDIANAMIYSRFDQSICVNPKKGKLKVVLFDLDDTLYNEIEYIKSGFFKIAKFLEDKAEKGKIYDMLIQAFNEGKKPINYVLESLHIEEPQIFSRCLEIYQNQNPDISLSDEIKNLLILLKKKGLRLGLITDGRPNGQRAKIEALGLNEYMDEIIITDELGGVLFRKPNDIAFRMMKYRFNVEYYEMVYIGDNIRKDFIAPKMLGMRWMWYYNLEGIYKEGDKTRESYSWEEICQCLLNNN